MRVTIEKSDVTTADGRPALYASAERHHVEAETLRAALLSFLAVKGGHVLGTVTETASRAVCTGWVDGRIVLVIAQSTDEESSSP